MPACEGLCNCLGNVASALAKAKDGCREVHGNRSVELKTGNHSLPGIAGGAVENVMQLEAFPGIHDVLGADGSSLVRHCPYVAGSAHGGEQRVFADGQGSGGHDAGAQLAKIFQRVCLKLLGSGINECGVSGPAGSGVNHINAAAGDNLDGTKIWLLALAVLVTVQLLLRAGCRYLEERTYARIEAVLRVRMFAALLRSRYPSVNAVHTGEWLSRIAADGKVNAQNGTYSITLPAYSFKVLNGAPDEPCIMPESDATAEEQSEPEEIEKSGCKSAAAPVAALIGAAALAVYKKKKETV